MTQIIQSLSEISDRYDALFVDLWGCVHDGVRALPDAVAALQDYRKQGGTVVLVTNSPRPRAGIAPQIRGFGVPDDAWDTIASSGDSARAAMFRGVVGRRVWFMGEEDRDAGFFEPIRVISDPVAIERVDLDAAEGIVCCGPFDPMADPEVNRIARSRMQRAVTQYRARDNLLEQVRLEIQQRLVDGVPQLEPIAERLGVKPWTLRRRLRAEQADFSTLLEEERRRLACDWLLHSNRSVNQIALDLGYSEQSAFNRAFKRWFGVTPVSYRDSGGH